MQSRIVGVLDNNLDRRDKVELGVLDGIGSIE